MKSIIAIALPLLLTGCGLRTEVVRVNTPDVRVNTEQGSVVVVAAVRDARSDFFPKLSADDRPINIGGVSRGGNVIFVNLESVTAAEKARDIMIHALRNMGYRTADQCEAACMQLDATLTEFSVKMPLNILRAAAWSQQMLADVSVQVTLRNAGQTRTFNAKGHGANIYQVVSRENWEVALERAVRDFTSNFKQGMSAQETATRLDAPSQAVN